MRCRPFDGPEVVRHLVDFKQVRFLVVSSQFMNGFASCAFQSGVVDRGAEDDVGVRRGGRVLALFRFDLIVAERPQDGVGGLLALGWGVLKSFPQLEPLWAQWWGRYLVHGSQPHPR